MRSLLTFWCLVWAATVQAQGLSLSWIDVADNEDGFRIERQCGTEPDFLPLTTLAMPNLETYADTSAPVDDLCTYRVLAYNAAGDSPWSNEASGMATALAVPNPPTLFCTITETQSDPSLVLALGFEEGLGTTAADSSGNGNHGTLTGPTWTTQGKYGTALSFNGASLVSIPDADTLDLTEAMTVEAWVYPTSNGGWRDVIFKADDMYYLEGSSNSSGSPPATGGTYAGGPLYAPSPLPLNTWSHLAATYDRTSIRLFLDGTEVANKPQTNAIVTSSLPLTIGGDAIYGQYWNGRIDEVRVYNRALTQAEIQADMATPVE